MLLQKDNLIYNLLYKEGGVMRVVCIAASCVSLLTTFGMMPTIAAEVSNPFIQQRSGSS